VDAWRRVAIVAPLLLGLLGCTALAWSDATVPEADPAVQERMALDLAGSASTVDATAKANEHIVRALALRPVWPYSWAALADVRYRSGVADETFELALRRAIDLGLNEPPVQAVVAFYGLAVWDDIGGATRAAVGRAIGAGVRRDAPEMVQIAIRRGRLPVACRYVDAAARVPDSWARLCKSTEAK
jgi:hypothetical protein